jgi:hypothetical protein
MRRSAKVRIKDWAEYAGIAGVVLIVVGTGLSLAFKGLWTTITFSHWSLGALLLGGSLGARLLHRGVGDDQAFARKKWNRSTERFVPFAGVITAFGLLLVLVSSLSSETIGRFRVDTTEEKIHSLSEPMTTLLRGLQRPVTIVAVVNAQQNNQAHVSSLLRLLQQAAGSMVSVSTLDVVNDRVAIKELGLERGASVYVASKAVDGREVTSFASGFSEQGLFDAIRSVSVARSRRIYYVEGHGEPSIQSTAAEGLSRFRDELRKTGIELVSFLLPGKRAIPEDADGVVVAAPQQALGAEELEVLKRYEQKGGALVLFHDPQADASLAKLAAYFGMEVLPAVALDEVQGATSQGTEREVSWQLPIKNIGKHGMFMDIGETASAMFLYAAPIMQKGSDTAEHRYSALSLTEASAWAEFDLTELMAAEPSAEYQEGVDKKGPLSLGMLREFIPLNGEVLDQSAKKAPSRVLVWGDIEWIRNVNIEVYQNLEIALASIEWVSGEGERDRLPARALRQSVMPITSATFARMIGLSALIPEIFLLLGLAFWWHRRSRSLQQRRSACL